MDKAKCPVCSSDVLSGDEAVESDLITCNNCGSDLEVVSLHPFALKEVSYDDDDLLKDYDDANDLSDEQEQE